MLSRLFERGVNFPIEIDVSSSEQIELLEPERFITGSKLIPDCSNIAFATLAPDEILTPVTDIFRDNPIGGGAL